MPTGTRPDPDDHTVVVMRIIRAAMGAAEMNTADLARKTEIPRATLSRVVNAKRQPYLGQLRKISAALGIPLPNLMAQADEDLASGT